MARLIDADALDKKLAQEMAMSVINGDSQLYREGLMSANMMLYVCKTVDAVPVIRCRNCRYYNTNYCGDGFGWCERNGIGHGTSDDWFCADGEKRSEDDEHD